MNVRYSLKVAFQLIILVTAVSLSLATSGPPRHYRLVAVYEYDSAADTWTEKEPVPRPRIEPVCQECGGFIYLIGGRVGRWGDHRTLSVDVYNPSTDGWSSRANIIILSERGCSASFAAGGKMYVMGGCGANSREAVEYDPITDVWTHKEDMLAVGTNGYCIVSGDDIYVAFADWWGAATGMTKYNITTDVWWTCAEPPGVVVAANGTIYAIDSAAYEYDPATNVWMQRESRYHSFWPEVVVAVSGKIYVFCEEGMPVEEYDPVTDVWVGRSVVPIPLTGEYPWWPAKGFAISDKIYLFAPTGQVWEYDPASDVWTEKSFFPAPVVVEEDYHHTNWYAETASWAQVGEKIYVIGGYFTDH